MAHVRNANTNRRANDDLEATPGYAPSGVSQWEREVSHGGYRPPDDQINERSRLETLILQQARNVARLERRLDEAGGDVREVTEITERLHKSRRFLNRLRAEQRQKNDPR